MEERPFYLLIVGLITGAISLTDIDLILAIILKLAAITSFIVSIVMTFTTKWEPTKNQIKKWFK